MTLCPGCLEPVPDGQPTCGSAACLRVYRFAERMAGRQDPMMQ